MQKIYKRVLEKMIEKKVTAVELTVMLHIGKYQDNRGLVVGVHYKDVCNATGICPQSFYHALKGLAEKEIIKITERDQNGNAICPDLFYYSSDNKKIPLQTSVSATPASPLTSGRDYNFDELENFIWSASAGSPPGLQEKPKIETSKSHATDYQSDYDILILGNLDYYDIVPFEERNVENEKPIYISLEHKMFENPDFAKMKTNAKLLAMLFAIYTGANEKNLHRNKKNDFYEKFCKMFDITKDTLRRYLTQVRAFFKIFIIKSIYFIKPKDKVFGKAIYETDIALLISNLAGVAAHRNRRLGLGKKENATLLKQDMSYLEKYLRGKWKYDVPICFLKAFAQATKNGKVNGKVNHKYIHKLFKQEMIAVGATL